MKNEEKERHRPLFRTAYLFRDLNSEELEVFLDRARLARFQPGATIIAEGEEGNDLFLIVSGSVRVTKSTPEGLQHVIGLLRSGDFFGEMALLDSLPRSASVSAHEPVQVALVSRRDLTSVFAERPQTAYKMVRTFAEVLSVRLRETNERIRTLVHLERSF